MLDFDLIVSKIIMYSRRVVKKVDNILKNRLENQAENHDKNKEFSTSHFTTFNQKISFYTFKKSFLFIFS